MIKAITGGYINIHPSTFRMSRPKGLPHFILLVVRSHGSFDIGSEHFSVEPPQIIILAPHTPNYYGNPDGDYVDEWLHFDTDEPQLIERLNAISNHPFSVEDTDIFSFCIHHILLELSFGQPDLKDENMRALFTFYLTVFPQHTHLSKTVHIQRRLKISSNSFTLKFLIHLIRSIQLHDVPSSLISVNLIFSSSIKNVQVFHPGPLDLNNNNYSVIENYQMNSSSPVSFQIASMK